MVMSELFPQQNICGIFSGFVGSSLEFHADLIVPYRSEFQTIPMHGQYILVQLKNPREAMLGRIVSLGSEGKRTSRDSEDANLAALNEATAISVKILEEELKGLKYRVNIHVLGILKNGISNHLTFVASHRRIPHLGSFVAFPEEEILKEIVGHNVVGAPIGHFALGEYIYAQGSSENKIEDWMNIMGPEILIRFSVESLISRRSFIFARAGFGKSNLNKLLFSELYKKTPTVKKRQGKEVPVGTILFDPDGEYFWPDDKGRPGLCDVPELQDKLVVFTPREGPSNFYNSFVAGGIKLDLRKLSPAVVLSIALSAQKQDQQNVQKLKGLQRKKWSKLVDLVAAKGNKAPIQAICNLLHLEKKQEVEAIAARSNMTAIVQTLHDGNSQFLAKLLYSLSMGKLCIIDISQLHSSESLILSGLILRKIFDKNQAEFTKSASHSIPTIAVIEEAQSVLVEKSPATVPHRDWVKEGRKYDLASLLITQQPGSIPTEILSQGDNWFVLHLLSVIDLKNLQKANSHFSQDIICMLLNEPIPGHATFWSSVCGKPYPVSMRVLSFEQKYSVLDPTYHRPTVDTFVTELTDDTIHIMEDEDNEANEEDDDDDDDDDNDEFFEEEETEDIDE
jgi:Predicted ATPase